MRWIAVVFLGCSSGSPVLSPGTDAGGHASGNVAGMSGATGGTSGAIGAGGTAGTRTTTDGGSAGGAVGTVGAGASTGEGGAAGMAPSSGVGGSAGTAGATTSSSGGVSGSGSGGAGGSSAGSGGSNAGTLACAGLVCEDFETGQIDAQKWDLSMGGGGSLVVQTQLVAHGKYAMHLQAPSGPSVNSAKLTLKDVPAALKGATTFGRAYIYVTPAADASIHIGLAQAGHSSGGADGGASGSRPRYFEVGINSGSWQLAFDLADVTPLVEEVAYPRKAVPTNRWACVEWQFEDVPDRVTLWVDGTQQGMFDNTDIGYASPGPVPKSGEPLYNGTSSNIIGGFDTLFALGYTDFHPQKAFDIYYDDVVLDSKRVGCLP